MELSKEKIECEKDTVVFICPASVPLCRLVGYHIQYLKQTNV